MKTQRWIAISVYVLVAIAKKRLQMEAGLCTILKILSVSLFERIPIWQTLSLDQYKKPEVNPDNRLNLFK